MCSKCDEINDSIIRYRRLRRQLDDREMGEAADRLLEELEAKVVALHSEE